MVSISVWAKKSCVVNSDATVRLKLDDATRSSDLVSAQIRLSRWILDSFIGVDARPLGLPDVHLSTLVHRTAARAVLHDGQGKIKWRSIEYICVGRVRGDIEPMEFLIDEIRTHSELGSQNTGGCTRA